MSIAVDNISPPTDDDGSQNCESDELQEHDTIEEIPIATFCLDALRDAQTTIDQELRGSFGDGDGDASCSDSGSFNGELQILESLSQELSFDLLEAEAEWWSLHQSAASVDADGKEHCDDATETDATEAESSCDGSLSAKEDKQERHTRVESDGSDVMFLVQRLDGMFGCIENLRPPLSNSTTPIKTTSREYFLRF